MRIYFVAAIGALIGFFASILGLLFKEGFDRQRQRRAAVNALRLMVGSVRTALDAEPDLIPHTHLDKMMPVLHDLATQSELVRAFLAYDDALRRYRIAWKKGAAPTDVEQDGIRTLLLQSETIIERHGEGVLNRTFDWIVGLSR